MTSNTRKLVKESEWMRVYRIEYEETYIYESKFLMDNLRISLQQVQEKWPHLSPSEKAEFSTAFSAQPPRDDEDQAILQFLMEIGPQEVWHNIAILLPFHRRPDEALGFLMERIERDSSSRTNYYQAIGSLGGAKAIPILRRQFDEYHVQLAAKPDQGSEIWSDYLHCAKTLWILTQDPAFLSALKKAQVGAPQELQPHLAHILREINQGSG